MLLAQSRDNPRVKSSNPSKSGFEDLEDSKPRTGPDTISGMKSSLAGESRVGTIMIDGGQSIYRPVNDWSDVLQEVSSYLFRLLSSLHLATKRHAVSTCAKHIQSC
jgi:hypothetical protein